MAIRKRTNKEGKIIGWQVTVEGVRGPNGERKRFSKTVRTQREAKETELKMLNQLANGGIQRTAPMTTETWVKTWLAVHKPDIEESTRRGYQEKIDNYIIPAMGHIPISHITGTLVQAWVKDLSDRGKSSRTIKNAHQCLYSAMKTATQLQMIPHNPCQYTILPKLDAYSAEVYDDSEIQAAIDAAKGTDIFLLVFLGLSVGLHRGELGALKWQHIVIHLKDGSPYHPDSLTQKWDRFMAKHGLKHILLHDLRHSCATSMVANHVDGKTVQHRLGHASYKTTYDLYVHRTQAMDDHAAEIMDSIVCK